MSTCFRTWMAEYAFRGSWEANYCIQRASQHPNGSSWSWLRKYNGCGEQSSTRTSSQLLNGIGPARYCPVEPLPAADLLPSPLTSVHHSCCPVIIDGWCFSRGRTLFFCSQVIYLRWIVENNSALKYYEVWHVLAFSLLDKSKEREKMVIRRKEGWEKEEKEVESKKTSLPGSVSASGSTAG